MCRGHGDRLHRGSLRGKLRAVGAGEGRRRTGGSRHLADQTRHQDHRRMARPAGVDHAPHPRGTGRAAEERSRTGRPEVAARGRHLHAALCAERVALDQARIPGDGRHLHAPRLLAVGPFHAGPRPAWVAQRLARRLAVPLPRIVLRPRRPRLQEQARAVQHAGAALHLPVGHPGADRRTPQAEGLSARNPEQDMAEYKEVSPNASGGTKLLNWIDNRFPLSKLFQEHMSEYYAPKNFNWWYIFGSLALFVLVIQIVTGIFLVMNYKPDSRLAFASVEYIMRDVSWGWLIRYMHSTGASAFFIVVYLHMFRGLLYGSYRKPRELVWIFGCAIFLCLMAEAFMGYLLPWGQMSYWGAQVIINLFASIRFIGPDLALLIRGDYVVGDATLNRFFALHVIAVPLVLIGLIVAHLLALHDVGSNNPDGVEIKAKKDPATGIPLDGIAFHPYYTVHDLVGVAVFLLLFSAVMFFAPEMGGYFLEANNFIPADPLKTPTHIAPVWYFTPYYSMLRAVTDPMVNVLTGIVLLATVVSVLGGGLSRTAKYSTLVVGLVAAVLLKTFDAKFWGVVVMGLAVMILFVLPWLDRSPVKSIRYKPGWNKWLYAIFVLDFVVLGYLGIKPPSPVGTVVSQAGTLFYFGFFLLMPWWSRIGSFKPVPDRVTFHAH